MRYAASVVGLALVGMLGCQPASAPREPTLVPPVEVHGTAGCSATVRCYKQCRLATSCIAACDAGATPLAQQQGHAVMRCALDSGCDGDLCVDERCGPQLEACHGAPVGALPDGARIDLAFRAPPGWDERTITGALELAAPDGRATLYVLPSRPWQGSPIGAYRAAWREALAGLGATPRDTLVAAPHRRRLANGYAVLVDGDVMATTAGEAVVIVYAMVARGVIVPIVGRFQAPDDALERTVLAWFEAAAIRNARPTSETLFDTSELIGAWTLVDTRTPETLELGGDGTYAASQLGVGGGRAALQTTRGNWFIEDALLVLQDTGSRRRRRILATDPLRLAPDEQEITLTSPRQGAGGWYRPGK